MLLMHFVVSSLFSRNALHRYLPLHSGGRRDGQDGRGFTSTIFKTEKSFLILGKNTLIVSIYGLNVTFEIEF